MDILCEISHKWGGLAVFASEAARQFQSTVGRKYMYLRTVEVRVQQRRRSRTNTAVPSQPVLVKHVEIRVSQGPHWTGLAPAFLLASPPKSHLRNYQIASMYVFVRSVLLHVSLSPFPSLLFSLLSLSLPPSPYRPSHSLFCSSPSLARASSIIIIKLPVIPQMPAESVTLPL